MALMGTMPWRALIATCVLFTVCVVFNAAPTHAVSLRVNGKIGEAPNLMPPEIKSMVKKLAPGVMKCLAQNDISVRTFSMTGSVDKISSNYMPAFTSLNAAVGSGPGHSVCPGNQLPKKTSTWQASLGLSFMERLAHCSITHYPGFFVPTKDENGKTHREFKISKFGKDVYVSLPWTVKGRRMSIRGSNGGKFTQTPTSSFTVRVPFQIRTYWLLYWGYGTGSVSLSFKVHTSGLKVSLSLETAKVSLDKGFPLKGLYQKKVSKILKEQIMAPEIAGLMKKGVDMTPYVPMFAGRSAASIKAVTFSCNYLTLYLQRLGASKSRKAAARNADLASLCSQHQGGKCMLKSSCRKTGGTIVTGRTCNGRYCCGSGNSYCCVKKGGPNKSIVGSSRPSSSAAASSPEVMRQEEQEEQEWEQGLPQHVSTTRTASSVSSSTRITKSSSSSVSRTASSRASRRSVATATASSAHPSYSAAAYSTQSMRAATATHSPRSADFDADGVHDEAERTRDVVRDDAKQTREEDEEESTRNAILASEKRLLYQAERARQAEEEADEHDEQDEQEEENAPTNTPTPADLDLDVSEDGEYDGSSLYNEDMFDVNASSDDASDDDNGDDDVDDVEVSDVAAADESDDSFYAGGSDDDDIDTDGYLDLLDQAQSIDDEDDEQA